jgi:chemotaxis protein methyltransferase CheR
MDKKINLTQDELQKIATYLQKHVGIALEEHKLKRFKSKIEAIFVMHKIEDFNSFYHRLRFANDEKLLQDLINAITVNETYFWREHEQFNLLVKEVIPKLLLSSGLPKIRILVLPCSSGEEIYSIMLSILASDGLIDKAYFELVGVDVDSSMIEKAKRGVYDKRSVGKIPHDILKKYFTQKGNLYEIAQELRDNATFVNANIFDPTIAAKLGYFDIVFSRNMLIYFNKLDKQRCFEQFYKLMKSKSYLFLGHADANGIDKNKFNPIKHTSHIFEKKV